MLAFALGQAPAASCGVSDEPAFATTKDHAVQVGSGAMSVAARERRYLDALRGPMGEVLQYKRTGSLRPEKDGRTILGRGWTAEPARLNSSPIVTPVTLQVRFGS
jgi:hypothetical protein